METGFESLENIHQSMFWQKLIFARFFRTNLISQIILNNKNIYLNSENPHFYKKNFFYMYCIKRMVILFFLHWECYIYIHTMFQILNHYLIHQFWLLKFWQSMPNKRPFIEWHQIINHVSDETLKHLKKTLWEI